MSDRKCRVCGLPKPVGAFYTYGGMRATICKACDNGSRSARQRHTRATNGDRRAYQAGTITVSLSMTPEERDRLDAEAARLKLSRSAFVRALVRGDLHGTQRT